MRNDALPNWYGAAGVNINITRERRRRTCRRKRPNSGCWTSATTSHETFERLSVTQQLRDQANLGLNLAQARYNLGLGSIVELGQAELQKTEADIADTDAQYQYRLTRLVLAYTIGAPK